MADYDFRTLSPIDFEHLVRDLLAAEWDAPVESFAPGPDGGIDLRHTDAEGAVTIVQCKHYAGSRFDRLLRDVRAEAPKVEILDPDRYVLVTSKDLTPPNKKALGDALGREATILGRGDLNGLLVRYPEVERRTVKLWLASSAVLDRIVHSDILVRSQTTADALRNTLRLYVQGRSHAKAQAILRDLHYCVIAGAPGIGKTTLAQVLVADHVARGYELVHVRGHVAEALRVLRPERRQVVYYDDFLGQTALRSKLEKNEDADLLDLIEAVRRSDYTRFLLTTREYILNQAKRDFERLATSEFDWRRCTVDLASYSRLHRAEILYNHLYFADLPQAYRDALLADRSYLRIIDHPGYNPRIISWMTTHLRTARVPAEAYPEEFVGTLDDPDRLWRHAFERQISDAARSLLWTLVTLPDRTDLDVASAAFGALHKARVGPQPSGLLSAFDDALREVEGTFALSTQGDGRRPVVSLQSPSVRDFLEARLREAPRLASELAAAAVSFEQVSYLHSNGLAPPDATWPALARTFDGPAPTQGVTSFGPELLGSTTRTGGVDRPDRLRYMVLAACEVGEGRLSSDAEAALEAAVTTLLGVSSPRSDTLHELVQAVAARPAIDRVHGDALRAFAHARLGDDIDELSDVDRYLAFYDAFMCAPKYTDAYWDAQDVFESVRDRFIAEVGPGVEWIGDHGEETTPEEIEAYDEVLQETAGRLDVPIPGTWSVALDRGLETAKEAEEKAWHDADEYGGRSPSPRATRPVGDAVIHAMFASLRA